MSVICENCAHEAPVFAVDCECPDCGGSQVGVDDPNPPQEQWWPCQCGMEVAWSEVEEFSDPSCPKCRAEVFC